MSAFKKTSSRASIPVMAAVVIAVLCAAGLYFMDFSPKSAVADGGINMITTATVNRAGATVLPTIPNQ
jgi:hypothetical protein